MCCPVPAVAVQQWQAQSAVAVQQEQVQSPAPSAVAATGTGSARVHVPPITKVGVDLAEREGFEPFERRWQNLQAVRDFAHQRLEIWLEMIRIALSAGARESTPVESGRVWAADGQRRRLEQSL